MTPEELNAELQNMDLSLFDQVLKGRFNNCKKVLDAGCGAGRNSFWFLKNGFDVHGCDQKEEALELIRHQVAAMGFPTDKFIEAKLANLPYADQSFDLIICNAVLHFAHSPLHFLKMFDELVRVMRPEGFLFIRMTSNFGLEVNLGPSTNGSYELPDGSQRFLLTKELLNTCMEKHPIRFAQSLKTVNVNNLRCMSTLLLQKEEQT